MHCNFSVHFPRLQSLDCFSNDHLQALRNASNSLTSFVDGHSRFYAIVCCVIQTERVVF